MNKIQNNQIYPSIVNKIRKKIGYRIFICIFLILLFISSIAIYYFKESFVQLEKNLDLECITLEDFIISQVLVPNDQAIQMQLNKFNKENKSIKLEWIKSPSNIKKGLKIETPVSWVYYYPLRIIDNENFGYFKLKGSFLDSKYIYYKLLLSVIILFMFSILITVLLYPMSASIPRYLFIEPIVNLLNTLKSANLNQKMSINTTYLTQEIYEIKLKIKELIQIREDYTKERITSKIAAQVAHDLNNPINGIRMIMPKIKSTLINTPEMKLLETYVNQISLIASDVLNSFRRNTSDVNITDNSNLTQWFLLEDMINNILANNKQWKCNIEFLNNEYSWVNLVPIKLQRVLTNLLNNAYESLSNPVKNITIKITLKDAIIELIIEDTGCGIPEDQIANVLQGKSLKHIGKGLGLSSAVEYFKEIGGSLTIESKQNIGTKVIITIPQSIPSWFTNKIQYTEDTIFMVLEDSISNISYWQKLLIITDNKKLYFAEVSSFKESIENNTLKNVILITNYTLYKKALEENITSISNVPSIFIVYDDINQCEAQNTIKKGNFRLIPHSLLEKIILEELYMT